MYTYVDTNGTINAPTSLSFDNLPPHNMSMSSTQESRYTTSHLQHSINKQPQRASQCIKNKPAWLHDYVTCLFDTVTSDSSNSNFIPTLVFNTTLCNFSSSYKVFKANLSTIQEPSTYYKHVNMLNWLMLCKRNLMPWRRTILGS